MPCCHWCWHALSSGAAGWVILLPQGNYTVFQSNASAVFNCSGDGYAVSWQLNGSSYNADDRQRGILVFPNSPTGTLASASLHIPSGATNNNTRVTCSVIDSTFTNVQLSETSCLTIQGNYDKKNTKRWIISYCQVIVWCNVLHIHVTSHLTSQVLLTLQATSL